MLNNYQEQQSDQTYQHIQDQSSFSALPLQQHELIFLQALCYKVSIVIVIVVVIIIILIVVFIINNLT